MDERSEQTEMNHSISFLVMDVDGTLTDGKIYMTSSGELFLPFDVKDGFGIINILPQNGIIPVVISARKSEAALKRCEDLNITEVHQGIKDKLSKLREILEKYSRRAQKEYSLSNVAYIGDDILDLLCMELIKSSGGIVGCPKDAVKEITEIADYVSGRTGGNGAVREFIEWLIREN